MILVRMEDFNPIESVENRELAERARQLAIVKNQDDSVPAKGRKELRLPFYFLPGTAASILTLHLIASLVFNCNFLNALFADNVDNRLSQYAIFTGAVSALLSTEITVVVLYLTIAHERFSKLFAQSKMLEPLFMSFMSVIVASCVSLAMCCLASAFDLQSTRNFWLETLAIFSLLLAFAYLVQMLVVLKDTGLNVMRGISTEAIKNKNKN